jgi:hypothetical protein
MVPCREWKSLCAYTGAKRMRLVKRWIGFKVVVERERLVEFRHVPDRPGHPGSSVLRVEKEWFAASPWDFIGQNFWIEAR